MSVEKCVMCRKNGVNLVNVYEQEGVNLCVACCGFYGETSSIKRIDYVLRHIAVKVNLLLENVQDGGDIRKQESKRLIAEHIKGLESENEELKVKVKMLEGENGRLTQFMAEIASSVRKQNEDCDDDYDDGSCGDPECCN